MSRPLPNPALLQDLPGKSVTGEPVLRIEDLSARPRFGCKGPEATSWLQARGFNVPQAANSALLDERGILVARLATSEFLIESVEGGASPVFAALLESSEPSRPSSLYPVARQDLVVGIRGPGLQTLLRQICSVDFVPVFAAPAADSGPIVLTSMMGVGVIAWPRSMSGESSLTVWLDPTFAHYFWTTLLETGHDIGATVIGSTT